MAASTPTTSNGTLLMRTDCPMGSELGPYSLSTTVLPSSTTLVDDSMSDWLMARPCATPQLRTSKYSGVVPPIWVVQFWSSLTTELLLRKNGAAAFTVGTSLWIAFRSSHVRVGWLPKPPRTPPEVLAPGITMSKFVPIAAKACSTLDLAPSPMATMAITAPTPITTPSVVKNERILLRNSARNAMRKVCSRFTRAPPSRRSRRPARLQLERSAAAACGRSRPAHPSG
ncbi:MAG: hypothetical protein QM756_27960 [Polyangiaceae bacterium]